MNTIKVFVGNNIDTPKYKRTVVYSKCAPLIINRAPFKREQKREGRYSITHFASLLVVARFTKLAHARAALKALLPIHDWRQGRESLEHNTNLLATVRAITDRCHGKVRTR